MSMKPALNWYTSVHRYYEKFISLQASNPLGVNSRIRSKIEESICSADGHVKADCFVEAIKTVEAVLHTSYLKPFCASSLFSKYFSGLITTIEKAGVASTPSSANLAQSRHRSLSSSSLNTTCSSETLSSSQNISTRNTLLASSTSGSARKSSRRRKSPDFLDKANQPDFLWRRQQSILTNIGHVDHLGRYRCLDHFGPPRTILNYFGPFGIGWTILDCFGSFGPFKLLGPMPPSGRRT